MIRLRKREGETFVTLSILEPMNESLICSASELMHALKTHIWLKLEAMLCTSDKLR